MKNRLTKAIFVLTLVAVMMIGCVGGVSAGETQGKKIAFTVPSLGNDFAVAVSNAMKEALEEQGCTVQIDSADGDITKQTDQVENYGQMGFDAIVIWPVNAAGMSATVKRVEEQGIQVLGFTCPIDGATASMVSADDFGMGEAQADMANEWIENTFPDAEEGSVKVLFVASSSSPEAVQRSDGIQTLTEKNTKVKAFVEQVDWNDPVAARNTIENALLVNPDIKAVCAVNGTTGVAANSYVMSANSPVEDKSQFAVFAVDDTTEIDDAIKASSENKAVLRGTISMGTIADTVHDFMVAMQPFLDGGNIESVNGSAFAITPETFAETQETSEAAE